MAVENQKSDQVTNEDAVPRVQNDAILGDGKVRFKYFKHTQGTTGDANSTAILCRIPAGQGMILKPLSWIKWGTFGSGRTLDVGLAAHTTRAGASVSLAADLILDGKDVATASTVGTLMGTGTNADDSPVYAYDSKAPIDVRAICLGDTWPTTIAVEGWIAYVPNK